MTSSRGDDQDPTGLPPGRGAPVRDRRVLAILALVVVAVLIANVASALLPGVDSALAGAPVIMALLVVATAFVLVRLLRQG